MSKRIVVLIAVGDKMWGEMALNMCLSIKANDSEQQVALIYTESAIKGIEPLIDRFFNYGQCVFSHYENYGQFAFWLKTRLYDYATEMIPNGEEFLFLDSDCIMVAGQPVSQWFDKHKDIDFTAYCNDVYDYKTQTRTRKDYTFWCDPEKLKKQLGLNLTGKIPQINSSFIYFKRNETCEKYFKEVENAWSLAEDKKIEFTSYKGNIPDELCFNIASAVTGLLPHKTHYRPIFFQFASETQNTEYILHYYKAFGFAGINKPHSWMVSFYNSQSRYYRNHYGIAKEFQIEEDSKVIKDPNPINIKIATKKTLWRRGEVEGSEGGIFNPSGIMVNGEQWTIYRKESDRHVVRGYLNQTAKPHLHILGAHKDEDFEIRELITSVGRYEDFRFFEWDKNIYVSHSIVSKNLKAGMKCRPYFSYLCHDFFYGLNSVELPIKVNDIEKNWAFFGEGKRLHCIYSISPYQIFTYDKDDSTFDKQKWNVLPVKQPKLNWFHNSYISNSTNPILIDDHYLMFFHTKEAGIYFHGAVLLDAKTKEITHYTRNSITLPFNGEGYQKNLLYVSGAMFNPNRNTIRVFAGEGDSHSICFDFDKDVFMDTIKQYPV